MSISDDARLDRIEDLLTDLVKTVNKFMTSNGERMARTEAEREQHTRDIAALHARVSELERDRATTSALGAIRETLEDIDTRVETIEREGYISKGKRTAYYAVAGAIGIVASGALKLAGDVLSKLLT